MCKGSIEFDGERIDGLPPHDIVKRGIVQVFEGRRVFEHLTVEENLIAGGHTVVDLRGVREGIDLVYTYFPVLKERRSQQSGYLSGGEQQMLAIGRGLMSRPKLVMLDEPSLGLAPMLTEEIFRIVRRLVEKERIAVLLVEQNAALALDLADHGYVIETGRIVLEGSGRIAGAELRREGVLPRPERGRQPQVLPRGEALPAPQALAVLIQAASAARSRWWKWISAGSLRP